MSDLAIPMHLFEYSNNVLTDRGIAVETKLGHHYCVVYSTLKMKECLIELVHRNDFLEKANTKEDFMKMISGITRIRSIIVHVSCDETTTIFSESDSIRHGLCMLIMDYQEEEGIQKFLGKLVNDFFEFASTLEMAWQFRGILAKS